MKKVWTPIAMVILLLVGFVVSIPLANNLKATNVEKNLLALSLPAHTAVVESICATGKLTGNGHGMQYFGAMLIKSELTADSLFAYYAQSLSTFVVKEQAIQQIACIETLELSFNADVTDGNYYVVDLFTDSSSPILDLDLRGH